ncbi:MAG TPA: NAD(P)-dependent oxidoreductase, partial [Gemmataceae bacterium]|nr:NAD(P)-dependent oxidoreductase [Gemmataceae bacterium]
MKNVLVDADLGPAALERLRALPGVAVETVEHGSKPRALPAELLRRQHVLVCKHPPTNFDDLAALELMQLTTVGYEHLRDLGLADRRVVVCNARGVFDTAIAEWVVAMMVNLTRDLPAMLRNQSAATWERAPRFQQEIRGRTVGLWGYGGIGRETARLAKALGLTVHVLS